MHARILFSSYARLSPTINLTIIITNKQIIHPNRNADVVLFDWNEYSGNAIKAFWMLRSFQVTLSFGLRFSSPGCTWNKYSCISVHIVNNLYILRILDFYLDKAVCSFYHLLFLLWNVNMQSFDIISFIWRCVLF